MNGNVHDKTSFSNVQRPAYQDINAFYWSVHAEIDSDETDLDSSLERAFVAECNISDSSNDSGIKVKWYDEINDDLKTGSYDNNQKLVDYSLSDDEADSSLEKSRDFDIRQFWSSGEVYNEDDAMDSFMNTKLPDDFCDEGLSFMKTKLRDDLSDEGLSSMGSDEEKETFV